MFMKRLFLFQGILCLTAPFIKAELPFAELPPFTVLGEPGHDTAITETYLPGGDLQLLGFNDITEAARLVPGITAAPGPRGGPRNERRLYMRGFDSRQILLLVDGIPFYIPYDGEPGDFERFRLWNAETVEVSKGISSILFGPNAMGGAINIATAPPSRPLEAEALLQSGFDRKGDQQEWNSFVRGGFVEGDVYGQIGASWMERDHWTLPDSFQPEGPPVLDPAGPGNLEDGGEREQSRVLDRSAFARVGWLPGNGASLTATFFHQQAEKEVPPYAGSPNPFERINFFRWSHWDRTSLFLQGGLQPVQDHELRVRIYYDAFFNRLERFDDWTYSTQATPRSFSSEFDDQSIGGSGQWAWTRKPGETWIGVLHFRRDHHEETANLLAGRRTPPNTFIDHTASVGLERRTTSDSGWKTMAGLSLDHRSPREAEDGQRGGASFELESTEAWNAVFSIQKMVTENLSTNVGIARKSRLPSMIDRYSYRQGRSIPNPGLDPERAWNSEVGLVWAKGRLELTANLFFNRVEDLMQEVVIGEDPSVPGRLVSQKRNVGEADFLGTEFSASWGVPGFEATLNYAFTERSLDNDSGYNLVGVPRHEAHLHLRFKPVRGLEVIPMLHLATERLSSEFSDGDPVDGFAIASIRTTWEWRDGLRLELGIENIFDDLYAYDRGYPEPGREFTVGLRWRY